MSIRNTGCKEASFSRENSSLFLRKSSENLRFLVIDELGFPLTVFIFASLHLLITHFVGSFYVELASKRAAILLGYKILV